MQRKDDLIAYLAHDLKTPLTSVIGYLSFLTETPKMPEEQRQKYLDTALSKSERLEGLINEFLTSPGIICRKSRWKSKKSTSAPFWYR